MITWTGHLLENHEIELNTNLSVDTIPVPQNLQDVFKDTQCIVDFLQEKLYQPPPASNLPKTSNLDQNHYDVNIFDQRYPHRVSTTIYIFKSRIKEMLKKMFVQKAC